MAGAASHFSIFVKMHCQGGIFIKPDINRMGFLLVNSVAFSAEFIHIIRKYEVFFFCIFIRDAGMAVQAATLEVMHPQV